MTVSLNNDQVYHETSNQGSFLLESSGIATDESQWLQKISSDLQPSAMQLKSSNSETYLDNLIAQSENEVILNKKQWTLPKKTLTGGSLRLQNKQNVTGQLNQSGAFVGNEKMATLRLIKDPNSGSDLASQVGGLCLSEWPQAAASNEFIIAQHQIPLRHQKQLESPILLSADCDSLPSNRRHLLLTATNANSLNNNNNHFELDTKMPLQLPMQMQMQMLTERDLDLDLHLDLDLDCADWSEHFCESQNSPLSAPSLVQTTNQNQNQQQQQLCFCSTTTSPHLQRERGQHQQETWQNETN